MNVATKKRFFEPLESRICFSQFGFVGQRILSTNSAAVLASADLDADGDQDLISFAEATRYGHPNQLLWYPNLGNGVFSERRFIDGAEPDAIIPADLDSDGDIDLITASEVDQQIAWYANDGTGQFGARRLIHSVEKSSDLRVLDIDHDGDLDFLVRLHGSKNNDIAWLQQLDEGSFEEPVTLLPNAQRYSFVMMDFNNDSMVDMVYKNTRGTFHRSNLGNGEFAPQTKFEFDVLAQRDAILAKADVDGDGDFDLLGPSGWSENLGQGEFRYVAQTLHRDHDFPSEIIPGDADGDGDIDLYIRRTGHLEHYLDLYKNDSDGVFTYSYEVGRTTQLQPYPRAYIVDDFGDGIDSMVVSFPDGELARFTGRQRHTIERVSLGNPTITLAFDVEGDADIDLVSSSTVCGLINFDCRSTLVVRENDGNGVFARPRVIYSPSAGTQSLEAVDLDLDGDLDLVNLELQGKVRVTKVAWFENVGGNFRRKSSILLDDSPDLGAYSLNIVDIDNDSDPDLLVKRDGTIRWLENLGNGRLADQATLFRSAVYIHDMAFLDIDNDADLDLITSQAEAKDAHDQLVWYQNDGSGSFANPQLIDAVLRDYRGAPRLYDVDSDGDQDLVTYDDQAGELAWHELAAGQFSQRRILIKTELRGYHIGDIDSDGNHDLFTWLHGKTLNIHRNQGGQQYGDPSSVAQHLLAHIPIDGLASIDLVDLDADGKLDVVSDYRWFEQRMIGDVNDDGRFDSRDLVSVFQFAKYEDEVAGNARFEEGDWNGDGEFDSKDLVLAFQVGAYELNRAIHNANISPQHDLRAVAIAIEDWH